MKMRVAGRLLALGAMALLLAGCFKVNMDVEVTPENTVSGTAIIAVDESLLELSGQSADQLFQDMDLSDLPAGASVDPYEEDGFVGQQITFDEVSLEDFRGNNTLSGAGADDQLDIVRQGDEFLVSGAIDMSGQEFTGEEIPEEFMDNFEFRVSITFPGEVKSATGDIDGNTVTWEPNDRREHAGRGGGERDPVLQLPAPDDPADRGRRPRPRRDRVPPHPSQGPDAGRRPLGDAIRDRADRRTPDARRSLGSGGPGRVCSGSSRRARDADPVPPAPTNRSRRPSPVPDPPEAPGAAIPAEDEPPPPTASG